MGQILAQFAIYLPPGCRKLKNMVEITEADAREEVEETVVVVGTVHKANVLIFKKGTAVEVKDVDFHMNKFDDTNRGNGTFILNKQFRYQKRFKANENSFDVHITVIQTNTCDCLIF